MSDNLIRTTEGALIESGTVAGPGSYSAGGFEISTDTGRVDEISVTVESDTYIAAVTGTSGTSATVEVYEQDGTVGYAEVADAVDLSGVTFSYTAYRT